MNKGYEYIDQYGSFRMEDPQKYSYLYFPVANDAGMKSSADTVLGGDAQMTGPEHISLTAGQR